MVSHGFKVVQDFHSMSCFRGVLPAASLPDVMHVRTLAHVAWVLLAAEINVPYFHVQRVVIFGVSTGQIFQ